MYAAFVCSAMNTEDLFSAGLKELRQTGGVKRGKLLKPFCHFAANPDLERASKNKNVLISVLCTHAATSLPPSEPSVSH